MVRAWKLFDRATAALERAFLFVAVLCVASIMLISVADAAMRYMFNRPFVWSYPVIANYLLVILFFFAVSEAQKSGHHINIDFIIRRMNHRIRVVCAGISSLCVMLFSIFVLLPALADLQETYIRNDLIPGIISWPRWPTFFIMTLGTLVLLIRGGADLLHTLLALGNRLPMEDAAP